eukprot:Protomagalhaensia_sp_Gyna_25__5047@NODE_566_length_3110_cov_7_143601_g440_i0_p1_GENE_NODE_566_length_3110_cov_7_143601_g440_i0NODE_566_length_3110_cov_7_143601_g440_i0_p1_ORF_typecomplete_len421_score56_18Exo_endo_phos/PF03372_23/5_6e25SEEK1/PF15357_6/0_24_NODE_566_length_3110_cov_7_143601_g440_i011263
MDAITLLTFNAGLMQYRFLGLTLLRNPPFTYRRLGHMPIALRAANADIVALQEVFEDWHADYLMESLRLIYPFAARRASGGILALHNGLLTFSKFPIVRTDFYKFKNITWSESLLGSKGVLETVINVPSVGLVCVLNAHMVSGGLDPESAHLDGLRAEETRELLEYAALATARGEAPVLLGDFNAAPTVCPASYNMLVEEEWEDGFVLGAPRSQSGLVTSGDSMQKESGSLLYVAPPDCVPARGKSRYSALARDECSTCDSSDGGIATERLWTWDPGNALNLLGLHANCHGLRCDHVFLPPQPIRGGLGDFAVTQAQILFHQPRVLIHAKWWTTCLLAPIARCFAKSSSDPLTAPLLVTLSDHYAVKVELVRRSVVSAENTILPQKDLLSTAAAPVPPPSGIYTDETTTNEPPSPMLIDD